MNPYPAAWFTELCPFPSETSSGRETPCPVPPGGGACPYAGYCRDEWNRPTPPGHLPTAPGNLNGIFESSYHAAVAVTMTEPSGSFVLRSEHHYLGKEIFRMPLRRHMYEVLVGWRAGDRKETIPADGQCPELTPDTRLGLYIGYADLRRNYQSSPLALALLAVPRKLLVDPDAHIVVGNYGALFGGPGLTCTVYSMQDDETAGAACAQACIIMVLGMLADRGARLEGSYTLTHLGYAGDTREYTRNRREMPEALREKLRSDSRVATVFPATRGLTPVRIVRVLKSLGIEAELVALTREPEGRVPDPARRREVVEKLALRMIECYVQARYPVILAVDAVTWDSSVPNPTGHAVTVVGIRKDSIQNREMQLILHDPAKQPYLERSDEECFKACWKYNDGTKLPPQIVMVMPTEAGVKRSLDSCWQHLKRTDPKSFRMLTGISRLHKRMEFDYQFSLEYAKDIHTFLWPVPLDSADRAHLDRQIALTRPRYWCVAGYQDKHLMKVWFYATDGGTDDRWEVLLYRDDADEDHKHFHLTRAGEDAQTLNLPGTLPDALRR